METTEHLTEWNSRIRLLDDSPLEGRSDQLDLLKFSDSVNLLAHSILRAKGPMIIHVDGAWGRGKTSYCQLLARRLRELTKNTITTTPEPETSLTVDEEANVKDAYVSWFVASDEEGDVADAILYSIAHAVSNHDFEESARILRTWGKGSAQDNTEVARLAQFRDWVERQLGWYKTNLSSSESPRNGRPQQIDLADPGAPSWKIAVPDYGKKIALIVIDDLDRCNSHRVREVMDAIRKFVNCQGLVFVIAADNQVVEAAFSAGIKELSADTSLSTPQAMEKYVRHRVQLPTIMDMDDENLLENMRNLQYFLLPHGGVPLLYGPSGILKEGIAVGLALTFRQSLTIRRLKRILNDFVVQIASAAQAFGIDDQTLEVTTLVDSETDIYVTRVWSEFNPREFRIRFAETFPTNLKGYQNYFISKLILSTIRYVWPALYDIYTDDPALFPHKIAALTAIGRELRWWPIQSIDNVFDAIVGEDKETKATSRESKRELCAFLAKIFHEALPPLNVEPVNIVEPRILKVHSMEEQIRKDSIVDKEASSITATTSVSVDELNAEEIKKNIKETLGKDSVAPQELEALINKISALVKKMAIYYEIPDSGNLIEKINASNWAVTYPDLAPSLSELATQLFIVGNRYQATQLFDILEKANLYTTDVEGFLLLYPYLNFLHGTNINKGREFLKKYSKSVFNLNQINDPENAVRAYYYYLSSLIRFGESSYDFSTSIQDGETYFHDYFYFNETDPERKLQLALYYAGILSAQGKLNTQILNEFEILDGFSEKSPNLARLLLHIADALATQTSTDKSVAAEYYLALVDTEVWTPQTIQNAAQLFYSLEGLCDRVGRLFQLAYDNGQRNSALKSNFETYLRSRDFSKEADYVAAGKDLPKNWKPFGEKIDTNISE